jgi:hypothetical protein
MVSKVSTIYLDGLSLVIILCRAILSYLISFHSVRGCERSQLLYKYPKLEAVANLHMQINQSE